jgi:methyl-accepting chemotaxis protein
MFKNLKLAMKIGGGFASVLLLTVVIAVLTIVNLSRIREVSDRNDMTSFVVQDMQTGGLAGKNFVIYRDDKYRLTVAEYMDRNIARLREHEAEYSEAEKKTFGEILKGVETYKEYFNKYGDFEDQKRKVENELNKNVTDLENLLAELYRMQAADFAGLVSARASIRDLDDKHGKIDSVFLLKMTLDTAKYSQLQYLSTKDAKHIEQINAAIEQMKQTCSSLRSRFNKKVNIDQIDAVLDGVRKYEASLAQYLAIQREQYAAQDVAAKASADTVALSSAASDESAREMSQTISVTVAVILFSAILAVLVGAILAAIITRTITGAMKKGVDFATRIAEGDLSVELNIHQKDEVGQLAASLQDMLVRLTKIVEEINSVALQVSAGSQELSSTSQEMSQGATEQAASVEEISSSMEQMTGNIKQNADNALQTEKIALKSAQAAEAGGKAVLATVNAMREIASKIGIIEEIARSTNMLALNASIEAARAGEYGKGFAVVASEVGKLAERSQKEAGEISKLSSESVSIAEEAGQTIAALIPDIKRTAELVQEISAASAEQNSGAEQINAAIMQLDQVVQQNASASEESASMSEELAGQAEQMQETMRFFKLKGGAFSIQHAEHHAAAPKQHAPAQVPPVAKPVAPKQVAPKPVTPRRPPAASVAPSAPATPGGGITLVLDDERPRAARDKIDAEYEEF